MKIIFSRKGFDSQYGRVPSPILEDGTLLPLPIPSRYGRPLGDLQTAVGPLHKVVSDLTGGEIGPASSVHLDPDLQSACVSRQPGWRPSLGQVASAQGHLAKQGVGPGDVFLFFGWFRRAESHHGRWRFVPGAPDLHSLFGWLQVEEVIDPGRADCAERYPWLEDHPHVAFAPTIGKGNTIYLGARTLYDGRAPGAGLFSRWDERLQLTAAGHSRSIWRVPAWMDPAKSQVKLTYHTDPSRWTRKDDAMHLRTVGKGQEFVMDVDSSTAAREWLASLVQ
jgi:hypothetical protein